VHRPKPHHTVDAAYTNSGSPFFHCTRSSTYCIVTAENTSPKVESRGFMILSWHKPIFAIAESSCLFDQVTAEGIIPAFIPQVSAAFSQRLEIRHAAPL
jgi:hypothetical protein